MGQYAMNFDESKNRLYIQFSGFFREAEANEAFEALKNALEGLPPEFDVVTDLSGFKPASPDVAKGFQKAARLVKESGRRYGVRVAGRIVTGLMQFKREIGGVFEEGSTRYASTVEEADRILDNWH